MTRKGLKTVLLDTLPVMTGYLFLGAGFGVLLNNNGYGIGWSLFMSIFIFAGSAQFLTVELLASHASLLSTAIAIALLNARHLFYGISLLDTYKNAGKQKWYMIFALTDETYTLVTQKQPPEGMKRHTYCLLVSAFDHLYWIIGSVLGSLAGAYLPLDIAGLEFVLTALFVTMFVEQWLSAKQHKSALIGVGATVVCLLIFGRELFLIPSMALIAVLLTVMQKTGGTRDA